MKRIISIAMCLAMVAAAPKVSAQQKERKERRTERTEQSRPEIKPEEMAKHMAERMKEQLGLTDAQFEEVLALNQSELGKREDTRPPRREEIEQLTEEQKTAHREEMRKLRDAYDARLKNILTDEQFAKYEEMAKTGPRGGRGDPKAPGETVPAANGETINSSSIAKELYRELQKECFTAGE